MLNLYLADIYKMRKSAAMKIVVFISAACAVTVAVLSYLITKGSIGKNLSGINFLLSDISMVTILGAVCAGVFICGDFDNRSIHEAVANGNSRVSVIVSKSASFITAVIAVILPYALVAIIAICTGASFSGSRYAGFANLFTTIGGKSLTGAEIGKLLIALLTLLIVYIGQLSICIPFAVLFKKPVAVVAVSYVLNILSGQLQSLKSTSTAFDRIYGCTPFGGDYTMIGLGTTCGDIAKALMVSILFTAVMMAITCLIFRKSEIK